MKLFLSIFLFLNVQAASAYPLFTAAGNDFIWAVEDVTYEELAYGRLCWWGENTLDRAIEIAQDFRTWEFDTIEPEINVLVNSIWALENSPGDIVIRYTYSFEQEGLANLQQNTLYLQNCSKMSPEFFE
jgi:hypothetical protein